MRKLTRLEAIAIRVQMLHCKPVDPELGQAAILALQTGDYSKAKWKPPKKEERPKVAGEKKIIHAAVLPQCGYFIRLWPKELPLEPYQDERFREVLNQSLLAKLQLAWLKKAQST